MLVSNYPNKYVEFFDGTHYYTVFIGRFAPFHAGHYAVVKEALRNSKYLIMVLGGDDKPRSSRDPFTTAERISIIQSAVTPEEFSRILFAPVYDYTYNNDKWIGAVVEAVEKVSKQVVGKSASQSKVALIGYEKDHTSFYLKLFPQWDSLGVPNHEMINATDIRNFFYELDSNVKAEDSLRGSTMAKCFVNPQHLFRVYDLMMGDKLADARDEYHFVQKYKEQWSIAPYPVTFNTCDAVVVQSGHILLVQRGHNPGKGLWALPGGFLNQYEKFEDGCIRELREETKIKIPDPVLRGSIVKHEIFDEPHRSARGRTISVAFLIKLRDDTTLPKVKGSDDAVKAKWVPISDFWNMRSVLFEDHYAICESLLSV